MMAPNPEFQIAPPLTREVLTGESHACNYPGRFEQCASNRFRVRGRR